MLAIAIKNLKLHMNNPHLPMGKNAVHFELSSQKDLDDKNRIFTITSYFYLFKFAKP